MKHQFFATLAALSLVLASAAFATPVDSIAHDAAIHVEAVEAHTATTQTVLANTELRAVNGTGRGACISVFIGLGISLKFIGLVTLNPGVALLGAVAPLGAALCR